MTGPFGKIEKEKFFMRLNDFKGHLHSLHQLWGLFAVPLKGRVGYQCSNFHRKLVQEGTVPRLNSGGTLDLDFLQKLEAEARKFLENNLMPYH